MRLTRKQKKLKRQAFNQIELDRLAKLPPHRYIRIGKRCLYREHGLEQPSWRERAGVCERVPARDKSC